VFSALRGPADASPDVVGLGVSDEDEEEGGTHNVARPSDWDEEDDECLRVHTVAGSCGSDVEPDAEDEAEAESDDDTTPPPSCSCECVGDWGNWVAAASCKPACATDATGCAPGASDVLCEMEVASAEALM
jgi:hypothetical protein